MEAMKPSSAGAPGRPPSKSGRRTKDVGGGGGGGGITKVEEKMLDVYGGRQDKNLPTTMMFDHVSPATRLLEKRRQMFEVQEALNSQKDEFSRREDAFRRREDGLRRKDLELQESLIKFNKFLKENESKRNRALKRAAEERKQREAKEMEIKKLEQQLKEKLLEENDLKEEVQRNLQYQDFLESVCQNMSKYFPEISDILNRYKTLRDANAYLLEKQQAVESANESELARFTKYKKDKENDVLNENNEIAEMQIRLEHGAAKTTKLQGEIDQMATDASDKSLTLAQVLSSVTNILTRCEESFRQRHNKPMVDKSLAKTEKKTMQERVDQTMLDLETMAMFMVDFRDVREEYVASMKGGGGGGGLNGGPSGALSTTSGVGSWGGEPV